MAHSISLESELEDESQRLVSDGTTVRGVGAQRNANHPRRRSRSGKHSCASRCQKRLISLDAQRRRVERRVRMLHCHITRVGIRLSVR